MAAMKLAFFIWRSSESLPFWFSWDVSWLVDMDEIEQDLQLGTMQCTVWFSIASWNC
jgi:hypothetical protein